MYIRTTQTNLKICWRASETQGPRSTFEIGGGRGVGGGGTVSDSILGRGTRHFFLQTLYNFKNIGGGGNVPSRPPCSGVPETTGAHLKYVASLAATRSVH